MSTDLSKWWRPPAFGLAAVSFVPSVRGVRAQSGALAEKLQLCGACHGEDGNSKMEKIPSLAGQPAFFILNQLFLMREGVRKVEAMAPIVKDLKDDDLTNLSQHFAKLPAKRSDEAGRSGACQEWRGDRDAAALRLLSSAEAWPGRSRCRGWRAQRIDYLIADAEIVPRQPASRRRHRDERRHRRRDATPTSSRSRTTRRRSRPQSQNAKVRVSMLSRGGALGGVLGSSKAECAVNFVATFWSVSNTLNTIASWRFICGK